MDLSSASKCREKEVGCLHQLTMAILSVSFVVGVVVNGLVLWMTAFRMTRTVTTIWFFNLALADFIVLLSLPVAIYNLITHHWPLTDLACKFYLALMVLTFFASIYLLALISVDRCVSVLYPVWVRNHRTVQRASWLALGVWLLAAITCSPYSILRTGGKQEGCRYCFFKFSTENEKNSSNGDSVVFDRQQVVTITHFLVGFLVPLVIISTCAYLIRAKLQQEAWVHASRPRRLLLVLVSAFFIFWFPFNVARLIHLGLAKSHDATMLPILWATFSLGCLNSCLNPFLYVFIGRDFKKTFFQSLPSALARAFGEEGFLNHPDPEVKHPGNDENLKGEAERPNPPV
ncbi:putative G-protein coupled receptor 32 isoform 1-T2 [Molossus nigricans]